MLTVDFFLPGPPQWSRKKDHSKLITRPASGIVTLRCPSVGKPRPTITWYKDNELFVANTMNHVSFKWEVSGLLDSIVPNMNGIILAIKGHNVNFSVGLCVILLIKEHFFPLII